MLSEYEKKRLENIEANKQILRDLGLERPPPILPPAATHKKKTGKNKKRKNKNEKNTINKRIKRSSRQNGASNELSRDGIIVRRSSRLAKLVKDIKFI